MRLTADGQAMGGRSFLAGSGFAIVVAAALIASLSGCSASESLSPPPATPTPASTATPVPIEFVRFFDPDEPWATEAIWYEIAEVPGEWPSLVSLPSTLRDDDGSFVEGIWGDGARVLTGRLYFSPGEDYVGDVIERLINAGFASEHSYSNRAGSVDRLRFGDSRVEISGTSFGYAIVDVIEMADQPEHQVLRPQEVVTTREVVTPTSSTAEASTDAAATNPFGHLPLTESTTRVLTAQGGEFDAITLIDLDAYEAVTIPRVGQFEATVQGDVPIWYVDDRYHVRGVGWDGVQRFSTDFELDRWYRQVLPLAAGGVALVTSPDGSDPVTLTVLDANGNQRCQNLVGSFSRLVEQGDELWSTNGRRFSADTCVSLGDLSMQYPRWLASSTEVYSSEYDVENRTWSLVKWQSTGSEWVVASEIPLQSQPASGVPPVGEARVIVSSCC